MGETPFVQLIEELKWRDECVFAVSHHFGFGLLDAGAMVELAMEWQTVPRQRLCTIAADFTERSVGHAFSYHYSDTRTHTHTRLTALCPGLPG